MMRILAIDPGCEQSACLTYDTVERKVCAKETAPNAYIREYVECRGRRSTDIDHLIVEMVASYGMAVGREVFETVYWVGRFCEAFGNDLYVSRIYRRDIKMTLCGNNAAKDANIRASLIDRFGPGKEKAIGVKATPGPLYGISKDEWSALAVAVTWAEMQNVAVPA